MPDPTIKTYPESFAAKVFFLPRHATKQDLFTAAADDQMLKKLQPSAETVKVALDLLKKAGLSGKYWGGLSASVSGSASVFLDIFGVRLVVAQDGGKTTSYLEDDGGKLVYRAEPKQGHSLLEVCSYLTSIVPMSLAEYPPRYPGKPNAWDKMADYHIWPHELRKRLSGPGEPLVYFNVCMLDTGLDSNHPYFNDADPTKLQVDHTASTGTFNWQEKAANADELAALKRDFANSLPIVGNVKALLAAVKEFFDSGRMNGPTFTWAMQPNADQADSARAVLGSDWLKDVIKTKPPAPTGRTAVESLLLAISQRQVVPLTLNDSVQSDAALRQMDLKLESISQSARKAMDWIDHVGQRTYDFNGHGTGMAASMLGVARRTRVTSFPVLAHQIPADLKPILLHRIKVYETEILKSAIEWATTQQKAPRRPSDPTEYRIVSNSYGGDFNLSAKSEEREALLQQLNEWKKAVKLAVDQNVLVLFAAGNSNPEKTDTNWCSLQALLGPTGAIVVGGAWDFDRTDRSHINDLITLSDAAHGLKVTDPVKTVIPDLCGFVGKEVAGTGSPYVYIPSADKAWHYGGGGTSSACAQVASLCGSLRAAFPNLDLLQIKKLVMTSGDEVKAGVSYQKKLFGELGNSYGPLRLINISKAFKAAREIKGSGK